MAKKGIRNGSEEQLKKDYEFDGKLPQEVKSKQNKQK